MQAKILSKMVDIPISTLRYYEREKIIPEKYISRDKNNYRDYAEELVDYLERIKLLITTGFTIREIQKLTDPTLSLNDIDRMNIVKDKLKNIKLLKKQLVDSEDLLTRIMNGEPTQCGNCIE